MTAKNILMPFAIFVCFSLAISCTPRKPPPSPKPTSLASDPCFIHPGQSPDYFTVSCAWPSGGALRTERINSCLQKGGVEPTILVPNDEGGVSIEAFTLEADQYDIIGIANMMRLCIEQTE